MFVNVGRHSSYGIYMTGVSDAVSEDDNGVILAIEVSAGSKRDQFPSGYNEWRKTVQCRISAPPVGGKANKAIISCIASNLDLRSSDVTIMSGATSSSKRVHINGMNREELVSRLSLDIKS